MSAFDDVHSKILKLTTRTNITLCGSIRASSPDYRLHGTRGQYLQADFRSFLALEGSQRDLFHYCAFQEQQPPPSAQQLKQQGLYNTSPFTFKMGGYAKVT